MQCMHYNIPISTGTQSPRCDGYETVPGQVQTRAGQWRDTIRV